MRLLLPLEAEVEPSGIEDVRFIVGGLFACVGGSELILAFAQSNPPKMLVHALCQPLYLCTHTAFFHETKLLISSPRPAKQVTKHLGWWKHCKCLTRGHQQYGDSGQSCVHSSSFSFEMILAYQTPLTLVHPAV